MNILVVDQSRMVRTIIREELEPEGYQVFEAGSVQQLYDTISKQSIDLMTLPVEFPEKNGYDLAHEIHSSEFYSSNRNASGKQVPIIFVTGNDTIEGRRMGFESGGADFVAKPFQEGDIRYTVKKILQPERRLEGLTALVVDDSTLARNIVTGFLGGQGVRVMEATDGVKGYGIIMENRENLDIVITDQMMPGLSGDELCFKVRKELNLPDLPVVVLSGVKESGMILKLFQSGATDYIIKPFIKEELLGRLMSHLEARLLHKKLETKIRELDDMNHALKKLSIVDTQTGLPNRKFFEERVKEAILRGERYGNEMTLYVVELHNYRSIVNDFGHRAGERILQKLTEFLVDSLRKTDVIARLGGERFGFLATETGLAGSRPLAKKLLKLIAGGRYTLRRDRPPVRLEANIGYLTLGKGSASASVDAIHTAEERLKKAQKAGPNRICCGGPETNG